MSECQMLGWGKGRKAWIATNGPIADGLWVLHKCDEPRCANMEHLFLGTPSDNQKDRFAKGRHYVSGPRAKRTRKSLVCLTEAERATIDAVRGLIPFAVWMRVAVLDAADKALKEIKP